ncbi:MAG: GIY-YIG nuclease family protein [Patescibacteria group bacterium]
MNTVYILRCGDGTLYTGSTADLAKRLREHNEQKGGAKYTRARRPVRVVYKEECQTFALARAREAEIKRLKRSEKLLLVKAGKAASSSLRQ